MLTPHKIKTVLFIVIITMCFPYMSLNAQTRWGIGMEFSSLPLSVMSGITQGSIPLSIYIPIDTSPTFRIEPQISIYNYSREDDNSTYKSSIKTLGVGAYQVTRYKKSNVYAGGVFLNETYVEEYEYGGGEDSDFEASTISYGPVVGCEILITEKLSISGEVFWKFSSWENEESDIKHTSNETQPRLILRFYL